LAFKGAFHCLRLAFSVGLARVLAADSTGSRHLLHKYQLEKIAALRMENKRVR
jgi:hypothetical protein